MQVTPATLCVAMQLTPSFDVALMQADMFEKGWVVMDLARKSGLSHMTVARFFSGQHQTPRTAKKLASALGHRLGRYLRTSTTRVA